MSINDINTIQSEFDTVENISKISCISDLIDMFKENTTDIIPGLSSLISLNQNHARQYPEIFEYVLRETAKVHGPVFAEKWGCEIDENGSYQYLKNLFLDPCTEDNSPEMCFNLLIIEGRIIGGFGLHMGIGPTKLKDLMSKSMKINMAISAQKMKQIYRAKGIMFDDHIINVNKEHIENIVNQNIGKNIGLIQHSVHLQSRPLIEASEMFIDKKSLWLAINKHKDAICNYFETINRQFDSNGNDEKSMLVSRMIRSINPTSRIKKETNNNIYRFFTLVNANIPLTEAHLILKSKYGNLINDLDPHVIFWTSSKVKGDNMRRIFESIHNLKILVSKKNLYRALLGVKNLHLNPLPHYLISILTHIAQNTHLIFRGRILPVEYDLYLDPLTPKNTSILIGSFPLGSPFMELNWEDAGIRTLISDISLYNALRFSSDFRPTKIISSMSAWHKMINSLKYRLEA